MLFPQWSIFYKPHFLIKFYYISLLSGQNLLSIPFINSMFNSTSGAKSVATLPITIKALAGSSKDESFEESNEETHPEEYIFKPSKHVNALLGLSPSEDSKLSMDYLLAGAFEELGTVALST